MRPLVCALSAAAMTLALGACGSDGGDSTRDDTAAASGDTVDVVAAFYPLEYLVTRIGGDRVSVSPLTPPGSEPHDIELTPDSLVAIDKADLVVYEDTFQPALDDALADHEGTTLDVSSLATRTFDDNDTTEADEQGARDPHFWNDPSLYAKAVGLVSDALIAADPDGEDTYTANAAALTTELTKIDDDAVEALGSCTIKTLVTAHDAFGYFAEHYGFETVSIAGISPDAEPSAASLADITETVRDQGITTIYTETLVSPDIANTLAAETGATTAVLDPLEGITDESAGTDYPSIMQANIAAVAAGQECS